MKICYTFSELRDWIKNSTKPLLIEDNEREQEYMVKNSNLFPTRHRVTVIEGKAMRWMPLSQLREGKRLNKQWQLDQAAIWYGK